MQFFAITFAALATMAAASPLEKRQGPAALCPAIDTPQCCQLDVLGVAAVTCAAPSKTPANISEFSDICAETGLDALCCTVPVAGLGLLCSAP